MYSPETQRPTWAEISLPALLHNFNVLRAHVSPSVQMMAVVKANAYGHGAVECARALENAGADCLGVALIEEGIELRRGGIMLPIICLGGFQPRQASLLVEHDLTPVLFDLDAARALSVCAVEKNVRINVHLKIDTGMGRLGISIEQLSDFTTAVSTLGNVQIDGVLTQLAAADSRDQTFTKFQLSEFERVIGILESTGIKPTFRHLANSAAIHAYPQAWGNLVRAGAALYGLRDDVLGPHAPPLNLKPVMSLHTRIMLLKEVPAGTSLGYARTFRASRASRIATLPIGYADGLRRALSNVGRVIVRGRFAPIVGRISMDLTIVDVTDVEGVAPGDEVILLGSTGDAELRAEELGAHIGTVSYEIVCGVSARVPRVYVS
jgi:alanine racemase